MSVYIIIYSPARFTFLDRSGKLSQQQQIIMFIQCQGFFKRQSPLILHRGDCPCYDIFHLSCRLCHSIFPFCICIFSKPNPPQFNAPVFLFHYNCSTVHRLSQSDTPQPGSFPTKSVMQPQFAQEYRKHAAK
jgi:hypothetical protein